MKVHLVQLEDVWTKAGERVGLVDSCGMIFISNVEAWNYSPLYPLSKDCREKILREKQYRSEYLDRPPLQLERELKPEQTFNLPYEGGTIAVRLLDIQSHDWRVLAAIDMAPVYAAANLDAAIHGCLDKLIERVEEYNREADHGGDKIARQLERLNSNIVAPQDPDMGIVGEAVGSGEFRHEGRVLRGQGPDRPLAILAPFRGRPHVMLARPVRLGRAAAELRELPALQADRLGLEPGSVRRP